MAPSSSNPAPSTRKRKWKANHVVRIELEESDGEDVSTAVVEQASRDGRRFARKVHSIPIPRDPLTLAASYNPPVENMDFMMNMVDENDEEGEPNSSAFQVNRAHLRSICSKLSITPGRSVIYLGG